MTGLTEQPPLCHGRRMTNDWMRITERRRALRFGPDEEDVPELLNGYKIGAARCDGQLYLCAVDIANALGLSRIQNFIRHIPEVYVDDDSSYPMRIKIRISRMNRSVAQDVWGLGIAGISYWLSDVDYRLGTSETIEGLKRWFEIICDREWERINA